MKKQILVLGLLLCCILLFAEQHDDPGSKKIPFNGLTGTVNELFKSKPKAEILLGSYYYLNPDHLVEKTINEIYNCDDVAGKYLTESEECYYEQFADIIEEKITNNVLDTSANVDVMVDASEEENIVSISIAVNYCKNVMLPIYVDTSNSELQASFVIPCTIEYNVSFNMEVDSNKVNNDDTLRGTTIRLDGYRIDIVSYEDDYNYTAAIVYNNNPYVVPLDGYSFNASIEWTLFDSSEYGDGPPVITYDQLCRGDYEWYVGSMCYVSFSGKVRNETDEFEISMSLDDSADKEDRTIEVTDMDGTAVYAIRSF